MGNLEERLTDDTGTSKCGAHSTDCHHFRVPPSYAAHLRDAGYHLLNQANNHGNDYGPAGYRNTRAALEAQGLKYPGRAGSDHRSGGQECPGGGDRLVLLRMVKQPDRHPTGEEGG
jgi:poly-gamma-glutamate capsule biosynthesis protein CapA/YwtB (metallophosphatase superfamily)